MNLANVILPMRSLFYIGRTYNHLSLQFHQERYTFYLPFFVLYHLFYSFHFIHFLYLSSGAASSLQVFLALLYLISKASINASPTSPPKYAPRYPSRISSLTVLCNLFHFLQKEKLHYTHHAISAHIFHALP